MKKHILKFLCLLITLCIFVGIIPTSLAYADEVDTEEFVNRMNVLRMLGIIKDYYDFNISFDEEVSRADYVDVIARLINTGEYNPSKVHYYDVLKSHYAYESISMLTEMGVVNGTDEKIFEPDSPISDNAAYKILVSLMGYGDIAHYNGGYPMGYVTIASRLEIFENSDTPNLTRGEMINILYNALDAQVLSIIGFSGDGSVIASNSDNDETLLSIYRGIYSDQGVVNGAGCITINDMVLDKIDRVIIDDVVYVSSPELNLVDYLGQKVEFFWFDNKAEDTRELLWLNTVDDDSIYLEVDRNASFNESTYIFSYTDESDRQKNISLDRGMTLLYNGRVVESGYSSILNKSKYTVKFVKTADLYNLAIVKEHENYIADIIDINSKCVYDKRKTKKPLSLDETRYDHIFIKNAAGAEMEVSAIQSGDVLSVFKSEDGKFLEIIVVNFSKSGILNSMFQKNNGYLLYLDGAEYYIPLDVYNTNPYKFKVGDSIKIYLDHANDIAYVTSQEESDTAAYVIDMVQVRDVFAEKVKLKLLLEDGTISSLECAEKVILDGREGSDAFDIKDAFTTDEGLLLRELILIRINSDGLVTKIDTPGPKIENGETEANSIWRTAEASAQRFENTGFFAGTSVIGTDTIIFSVPTEASSVGDEEKYDVIQKSDLISATNYDIATYNTTDRVGCDKYIVVKRDLLNDNGKTRTVLPVLVTGSGNILGEDRKGVEYIEGYQGAALKTFKSDGKYSFKNNGISEGMLIQISTTADGYVADAEVLFNPSAEFVPQTGISPIHPFMVNIGYVSDVVDNVVKFGFSTGANVDYVAMKHTAPVLVYDSSRVANPAFVGSFADAKRYHNLQNDSECSKIVSISRYFVPYLYVIYN